MHRLALALTLFGSLGVAACGGTPSAQSICDDACEKQASCTGATTAELSTCKKSCKESANNGSDSVQQVKDECKNADEVINAINHCVTSYCDASDVNDCVNQAAGTCDAK